MTVWRLRRRISESLSGEPQREYSGIVVGCPARNVSRVRTDSGHGEVDAINTVLPCRPGLPVRVRYVGGAWRVVGIDHHALPDPGDYHYVPWHAEAHTFNSSAGGDDVVWLDKVQYTPLLVAPTSPPSLSVRVLPGLYYNPDGELNILTGERVVDISPYYGSETRYALVTLRTDTGELSVVASASRPTVAPGEVPLGLIRLVPGATAITWSDLFDARDVPPTLVANALRSVATLERIVRYGTSGTHYYALSPDGLNAALLDAAAGDVIIVPRPLRLSSVTIPSGVTVDFGLSVVSSVSGGIAVNFILSGG